MKIHRAALLLLLSRLWLPAALEIREEARRLQESHLTAISLLLPVLATPGSVEGLY